MKPFVKIAVVAGGYLAAFLMASAVVAIHFATTSGPNAQASSGMYAFGDALLFVARIRRVRSRAHRRSALLPQTLPSLLDSALGIGPRSGGHGCDGSNPLRRRQGCAAFAPRDMGRVLRAQDPRCATPRTHLSRVHNPLAAPLPSVRVSRGNRDGGGSERVRRIRLVRPSVLQPVFLQAIAIPV